MVLPSWREGLSKILLEAGSMEIGLVTYNVPGCNNVVENNKTGLLVKPRDINSLSNALEKLIKDKSYRENLGKNCRKKYKKTL